jgi:1,2-diacylglycerol 3-beta-galactosyltransferase
MGGGEGGGGMHKIIKEFQLQKFDGELIVIAGRNKVLENKLKREANEYDFSLRVYGFTDQVYELMGESDIIITKAGPGTIADALAMNLPIIITSWLPGQEEGNVDFVLREKVGKVCKDPQKIVETVKAIQNPVRLKEMKKNIKRVSKPKAALEIAREIYSRF